MEILIGDEYHDKHCERACINCILDFTSQNYAKQFNRREAVGVMRNALNA
jgi:hypothetical protein